jgi:hypothetical protein
VLDIRALGCRRGFDRVFLDVGQQLGKAMAVGVRQTSDVFYLALFELSDVETGIGVRGLDAGAHC